MQPIQWSHVDILAKTHAKYAVRGGSGLIYLLTFLIVSLSIAGVLMDPLKIIIAEAKSNADQNLDNSIFEDGKIDDSAIVNFVADFARPVVAWWVGVDEADDLLFSVPLGPEAELNGGGVSDSLRQAFQDTQPLSANASVSVVEADRKWRIDDENRLYVVQKANAAAVINVREVDPLVEYLVVEQPPLLSAYILVLMVFIPFLSCLVSFNQLAGDIGTQGLRYLLLRTERINIIVARLLGTILFSAVISLAVMLIVVTYLAVQFDSDSFLSLLKWGLVGWLAMLALSLPYICLGTWLSAAFDSPIATLVLCILATAFPIIFLKAARAGMPSWPESAWLDRLTPWGWMYDLLHPHWQQSMLALLVMLGFAVLLGFLAMRHFLKRDL